MALYQTTDQKCLKIILPSCSHGSGGDSITTGDETEREHEASLEGKEAIKEMKKQNYPHWKQMEWIGFYFEFLCQEVFGNLMEYHKISYGRTSFDGFLEVPFDFKAHALNTESHQVIINDTEATVKAIDKYGCVVVIMALCEVKYNDEDRTFQKWHEDLEFGWHLNPLTDHIIL